MNRSSSEPTNTGRIYTFLYAAALAVFAVLLTVSLGVREFWTDEIVSAGHVERLINTRDAFHPRGYYLLLYAWKLTFGGSDLSLRLFSLPWSMLVLILATAIGRRTMSPRQVALGQWLLVLSPFMILYFRMARFYSLVSALFLLVVYCALLVAQVGRRRHWIAFSVAAGALLAVSYIAATMLAPIFIWLLVIALRRGQWWRPVLAVIPCILLGATYVRTLSVKIPSIHGIEAGAAHASLSHLLMRFALPAYSLAAGETTDPWRIYITIPAVAVFTIAFVFGLIRKSDKPGGNFIRWAWLLSVGVVGLALSTIARAEPLSSAARSTIFAAPLAYLLVAVGLDSLRRPTGRAVALAVILVSNAYGLVNYFAGRQFLNPAYVTPWRAIAGAILEQERPTDRVLSYYDTTIERYARFSNFVYGRPDYHPENLTQIEEWPKGGFRIWLVCRDRGSAEARRLQQEAIEHLTPRAAQVQVTPFMPYSPLDRRFRRAFLRREIDDAYVKLYLFTAPTRKPSSPGTSSSVSRPPRTSG